MGDISVRVLVIQEGDTWVAQALEYDIGAQAPDLDCLKRRFEMTVDVELDESVRRTGIPFGGLSSAPSYYHEMWESCSTDFRSLGESSDHNLPHINYEMKIAA